MVRPIYWLGIDPGSRGAAALVDPAGMPVAAIGWARRTESEIAAALTALRARAGPAALVRAVLERVTANPRMARGAAFSFGRSYGLVLGLVVAAGVPVDLVSPARWQRTLGCLTGGNKQVTLARARGLFPGVTITRDTADAWLIAYYGWRHGSRT